MERREDRSHVPAYMVWLLSRNLWSFDVVSSTSFHGIHNLFTDFYDLKNVLKEKKMSVVNFLKSFP